MKLNLFLIASIPLILLNNCESETDPQVKNNIESLELAQLDTTNCMYTFSEPGHILMYKTYYLEDQLIEVKEKIDILDGEHIKESTTETYFDNYGIVIAYKYFDFKDRCTGIAKFTNEYNASGRLTSSKVFYSANETVSYFYNDKGNISSIEETFENSPKLITKYIYDTDNLNIRSEYYCYEVEKCGDEILFKYNADNLLVSRETYEPNNLSPSITYTYEYDQNGNRTKESYFRLNELTRTTTYVYDDYNRLISKINSKREEYNTYSYSNDNFEPVTYHNPFFYHTDILFSYPTP